MLALEGTVITDLTLPLPGDLKDISKAAPLVSGVVEDRIPALLNRVRATTWDEHGTLHAYEFRKSPIGFPDILLVKRADPAEIVFEIEAKSWYILSGDALTARFLTAPAVIGVGTLVVIVAWMLNGVVSGSPILYRIHVDDAARLAAVRDNAWTGIDPPGSHRVVQPNNAPGTPLNLRQTQVRAEQLDAQGNWVAESENFGKLERLHDPDIQAFRDAVLDDPVAFKPLRAWRAFVKRA